MSKRDVSTCGCSEKEQELQLVREEMARQEGQLRVTKSELIETRMQVQEKDSQLKVSRGRGSFVRSLVCSSFIH